MRSRLAWLAVAALAFAAGAALWWLGRPAPRVGPAEISGAALYAASFRDLEGRPQSLGQFQGRILVLNFWATWCAPCREEMPAFDRVARRWKDRGIAIVGVSQETPDTIARFRREIGVSYPLWAGGGEAAELARRLGNRIEALPFTALVGPDGRVAAAKVGSYTEPELDAALTKLSANFK